MALVTNKVSYRCPIHGVYEVSIYAADKSCPFCGAGAYQPVFVFDTPVDWNYRRAASTAAQLVDDFQYLDRPQRKSLAYFVNKNV